jgi:hypothetical protein
VKWRATPIQMSTTHSMEIRSGRRIRIRNRPRTFTAEIVYGLYEMLPANECRTICELSYMYDLSSLNINGFLLIFAEFNGIEHSGEEQARINVAYQMDPKGCSEPWRIFSSQHRKTLATIEDPTIAWNSHNHSYRRKKSWAST